MKPNLFTLAAALEGLEDQTSTESTDTPVVPAETDPVVPTETTDPLIPTDPVDATLEPIEDPVEDPDKPIEFPDIGNLNVDLVSKELASQQEERDEAIKEATEEAKNIAGTMEALCESFRLNGSVSPALTKLTNQILANAKETCSVGAKTTLFALEKHSSDGKSVEFKVVLEGFASSLAAIWKAILRAIAASFAWLKKAFHDFFFSIKQTKEKTIFLTKEILKLRAMPAFIASRELGIDNDAHYVNIPTDIRMLSINGVQPGWTNVPGAKIDLFQNSSALLKKEKTTTYPEAYDRVADLMKLHKVFETSFGVPDNFVNKLQAIIDAFFDNKKLQIPLPIVDTDAFIPENSFVSKKHPTGNELKDYEFYICKDFLGDASFTMMSAAKPAATVKESLTDLGNWNIDFSGTNSFTSNGWLRFLHNDEIKESSASVVKIEDELLEFEKTVARLEELQKKIDALGESVVHRATNSDFDPAAYETTVIPAVIASLNSVKDAIANILPYLGQRGHRTCTAWNNYLVATYKKEYMLVNPNAKVSDKINLSLV
jgi:hypothetical protein